MKVLFSTTTSWPRISKQTTRIRDEMEALVSGGYVEVDVQPPETARQSE